MSANYRLFTKDTFGNRGYIVRKNDCIRYMSGDRTPLALSYLAGDGAAELCFQLEDAGDANEACNAVREFLRNRWRNNPRLDPDAACSIVS